MFDLFGNKERAALERECERKRLLEEEEKEAGLKEIAKSLGIKGKNYDAWIESAIEYFSLDSLDKVALFYKIDNYYKDSELGSKIKYSTGTDAMCYLRDIIHIPVVIIADSTEKLLENIPKFELFEYGPDKLIQAANITYWESKEKPSYSDVQVLIDELKECLNRPEAAIYLEASDITSLLLKF